jgi:hypothetical protein
MATYLGGNGIDTSSLIRTDNQRNAYVVGTAGNTFPTKNAFQSSHKGLPFINDLFITKIGISGQIFHRWNIGERY